MIVVLIVLFFNAFKAHHQNDDVMNVLKKEDEYYQKIDWKYWLRPIAIYNCITGIQMQVPTIDLWNIDTMIGEHNNKKLQSLNESFQSYSSWIIDWLQGLKSRLFPKQ